jgi:branched-chain amino acid transport system permease protein
LSRDATIAGVLFVLALILPLFFASGSAFIDHAVTALAYVMMALGLNIVVGFAGLLDLGFVAFYALGALTIGWLASGFVDGANHGKGIHVGVSQFLANQPGIHLNFLLVLVAAVMVAAVVGILIGLPTLRLRGDYIAIVTLAFGEIIRVVALNGDTIKIHGQQLTNGAQGITPIDKVDLPFGQPFTSLELRPWYYMALALVVLVLFVNFRLRDSRLGRAWIAVREDEVAAASMGVPLVRTKLFAYATGGAFGLAMVILGGLGSIWGVVLGGVVLSQINFWLIPDVLNDLPSKFGLDFDLTEINFLIFGFLLVIMMVLRPQGLLPERRRKAELTGDVDTGGETLYEVQA